MVELDVVVGVVDVDVVGGGTHWDVVVVGGCQVVVG